MATQNKFTADLGIKTDADLQVDGSVTVTGDLTVNGTQTTVNSTTTSVTDSLFELANSNTDSDTLDIGIYGNYDDGLSDGGASEYTGLFRDASDSTWKLFDGLEEEPSSTINTSGTGFTLADLQVGDLTATTLTATNSLTGASITYPTTDGTNGQVLTTDGSGTLSFTDVSGGISYIIEDTTPQLGGDLDLNSNDITGTGDINVTGTVTADGLTVRTSTGAVINLEDTGSHIWKLTTDNQSNFFNVKDGTSTTYFKVGTEDSEFATNLNLTSGHKLGIGTTSPTKGRLVVTGAAYDEGILIERTDTSSRWGLSGNDSGSFQIWDDNQSDSTRLVIDSSGNVLVGKTVTSSNTAGMLIGSNGRFDAVRDGGYVGYLNRLTSDGDIAIFAKDDSIVASIGAYGGASYIGGNTNGSIYFNGNTDVRPFNKTSLANYDNQLNLGGTTSRWKDLYLSGGAYLGGTSSANYLDDYEEGTWTPSIRAGGTALTVAYQYGPTARYTKIGRMVHVHLGFRLSSISGQNSTALRIYGLPFASIGTGGYQEDRLSAFLVHNPTADHAGNMFGFVGSGLSYIEFRYLDGGDTILPSNSLDSDTAMSVYGIYYTNS